MVKMPLNHLDLWAKESGLEITGDQHNKLYIIAEELDRWSRSLNLTAIKGQRQVAIKHIIDSLHMLPLVRGCKKMLDIGSGAGFPCVPIAVMCPDLEIISVDAVMKKIGFQRHLCRLMGLDNLKPTHCRIEQLDKNLKFDLITSRAFSDLASFAKYGEPFLSKKGMLVAMRGPDDEKTQNNFNDQIEGLGLIVKEIRKYSLPEGLGERTLVELVRKAA